RRPPTSTLCPYPTLFRSGQPREPRDVPCLELGHRLQVAEFQLGHATAGFLLGQYPRDPVVLEDRGEVMADARLVVVDVAGGEDRSEEHTSELQSRENLVC